MNNPKKHLRTGLIAIIAGSFVSLGALAGDSSPKGPPSFSDFDMDGSGYVSEDEFNTTRGQRMAAKAKEGKQLRGAATAPAFPDIDTDGDGLLNAEELAAAQKAHMHQHHGKDMGGCQGDCPGMGKGKGMGYGHGQGKGQGQGQGKGQNGIMPAFSDFDLDGDGKIIESEFNQGHARKMSEMAAAGYKMKHAGDAPGFSGIDTDNDGEISQQEFSRHQAEHHGRMHKGKNQPD